MCDDLTAIIKKRAKNVLQYLQPRLPQDYGWAFFISGSSITSSKPNPRDIDIFTQLAAPRLILRAPTASETLNATTYELYPIPVQVCNFHADSLPELLAQFDFTHVQAGVTVRWDLLNSWRIESVQYTPAYAEAIAHGATRYINSPSPLGSLLRVAKYYQRAI